jgi:hypothetical protein
VSGIPLPTAGEWLLAGLAMAKGWAGGVTPGPFGMRGDGWVSSEFLCKLPDGGIIFGVDKLLADLKKEGHPIERRERRRGGPASPSYTAYDYRLTPDNNTEEHTV